MAAANTVEIVTKLDVAPALQGAEELSQKLAKIPDVKIAVDAGELVNLESKLEAIFKGQLVQVIVETVGEEALNNLAETLNQIGESARNATEAVQGVLKQLADAASQAALEIEDVTDKLATITDQADALTAQIRQLSGSLDYAVGTGELLGSAYEVISAGFSDAADTLKILEAAAKGATAGFSQTVTVVDALTSTLNAYGEGADLAAKRVDQFIQIQNLGKLTVDDLAQSLGNVITTAAQAGVSFEEVGGFIAVATGKGVSASEAIVGLNRALSAVLTPSEQAKKLAEELGIQFDAAALRTKGLTGILAELQQKGADSVENLNILFGSLEALRTILPATGEGAEILAQAIQKISNASGTTETAFAQVQQGLGAELARLTGQIQELLAQLGEGANAVLTPLVQALNKLLEVINAIPEPIKRVVGGAAAFLGIFAGVTVTVGLVALKLALLQGGISLLQGGLKKLGIDFDASGLRLQAWILALTGSVSAAAAVGTELTDLSLAQSEFGQAVIRATKALIAQGQELAKSSGIVAGIATEVRQTSQMIDQFVAQATQKLNKFAQVTAAQIPQLDQEGSALSKVSAARAAYNAALERTIALKQKEAALLDRADVLSTKETILQERVKDTGLDLDVQKINAQKAQAKFREAAEQGENLEFLAELAEDAALAQERLTIAQQGNSKATEQLSKVQKLAAINAEQLASVQQQLEEASERAAKAKERFNEALAQAQNPAQKAAEATTKSKNALMGLVGAIGPMLAQMALMYAAFETMGAIMRTFEDGAAELSQTLTEIDEELDRLSKKRDALQFEAEPPKDADWLDPIRRFLGLTTLAQKRLVDVQIAFEKAAETADRLGERTKEILAADVGGERIAKIDTALKAIATGGAVTETQLKNIQKALRELPASVPAEAIAAFQKELAKLEIGDSLSPERLKQLQIALQNLQGAANNTAIREQIQLIDQLIKKIEEQLKVQGLDDFTIARMENVLQSLRNQKTQLEQNRAATIDLATAQQELAKTAEEAAKAAEEAYAQALEGIKNAEQAAYTEIAQAQATGAITAQEADQQRLEAKRAALEEELKLAKEAGKDTAKIEEDIAKTEIELQEKAKDQTIKGIELRKKAIEAYYDAAIKGQEALAQEIEQESKLIDQQIQGLNKQLKGLSLDKEFEIKKIKDDESLSDKEKEEQIKKKNQEFLLKEFEIKEKILQLEQKQAELAARKLEIEAKKAVLAATKQLKQAELELQSARKEGDAKAIKEAENKLAMAREELALAKDQKAFADENSKAQKELARITAENFQKEKRNALQEAGLTHEANALAQKIKQGAAGLGAIGGRIGEIKGRIEGMTMAMDGFTGSVAAANSALERMGNLLGKGDGMSLSVGDGGMPSGASLGDLLGRFDKGLSNLIPGGGSAPGRGGMPGGASLGDLLGRAGRGLGNLMPGGWGGNRGLPGGAWFGNMLGREGGLKSWASTNIENVNINFGQAEKATLTGAKSALRGRF